MTRKLKFQKKVNLHILIPQTVDRKLNELALQQNRTKTEIIEEAIMNYLKIPPEPEEEEEE